MKQEKLINNITGQNTTSVSGVYKNVTHLHIQAGLKFGMIAF
jgi:hypothetical protein